MVGLAAEYLFLGGLWEKLGVEVEVERVGDYKSAVETIAERQMCAPKREMANSLLDSIDAQFVAGHRGEPQARRPSSCARAIDEAPVSPEQMKKLRPDRRRSSSGTSCVGELGGKDKLVEADDYAARRSRGRSASRRSRASR